MSGGHRVSSLRYNKLGPEIVESDVTMHFGVTGSDVIQDGGVVGPRNISF